MSEFGTGFAYNLGLFLCHEERRYELKKRYEGKEYALDWPQRWFNGASDHLYDLKIPDNFSHKESAHEFEAKCFKWKNAMSKTDMPTEDDVSWTIQTAKDLLRAWDVQCGIESEKGEWE